MLIKEPFASTAASLISRCVYDVHSLEKLSIPLPTPILLSIISDVTRCSSVLCQWSLLVFQQVGGTLLKCRRAVAEEVGGACKFLSSVLNQQTPIQEIVFFPLLNGMRFGTNLGCFDEKINVFVQVSLLLNPPLIKERKGERERERGWERRREREREIGIGFVLLYKSWTFSTIFSSL